MQLLVSRSPPQTRDQFGDLTRLNKIAIQGAPQMTVDKEAISLSRVYSYYSNLSVTVPYSMCDLP